MELEIVHAKSNRPVASLEEVPLNGTVEDVKKAIALQKKKYADLNRQELRLQPGGKALKDDEKLASLEVHNGAMLYFKDRGIQIAWKTVFLTEYAGPLFIYLWIATRPWIFYGEVGNKPYAPVVKIAAACWSFHYAKRLLETLFVHRFSNATMPLRNIFKNSGYYWGFAAYVAYHVNHPLYTPPSDTQVYVGAAMFALCEIGNFFIHTALRDLRPPGTKVRKIPHPTGNPFTQLFNFVSCPNYTYEIGAWISFSVMTQCLPALLFCFAGAYQMVIWALGKHRNYRKEFKDYPRRRAIFPFIL